MTEPDAMQGEHARSRKRPPTWRWPILRPGRVERSFGEPCEVCVDRFRRWLRARRQLKRRGADAFGAVEVVMAAVAERSATMRPTERDVQAVLRRLRNRYPPAVARTIAADGRAARAVLRGLKPAMVRCAAGAWKLNRQFVRARGF